MKNKMPVKHKIFLILLGSTLILVGLELFLRLHPKFGYRYDSFNFKSERLALNDMSYMQPSEFLGYEHIPNCNSSINSYGLIGKKYKLEKNKNTFRILLLGDSIAEQHWPAEFLEMELNADPKLCLEHSFEIWNAGVASYDVRRYALYLEHKGLKYKPDMVIIFLFMNDFRLNTNIYYKTKNGTTEYHFPVSEISKVYIPKPFLMKHSYLYRFVILRLDNFLRSNRERSHGINQDEENGKYYLKKIEKICKKNSLPLVVVIFPYLKLLDEYENYQMQEYLVVNKVVRELKIPYYNLVYLYERLIEKDFSLRHSANDDIHPSKEGSIFIADEIFNYIVKDFL